MSRIGVLILVALVACKPPKGPAKPDPKVAQLEQELADTKGQLQKATDEANALREGDAELKAKAEEAAKLEAKLAEVVGKAGEVTTADGAVRLELVDQILFPVGEADLTEQGKEVLSKVGAALKEIPDKQVWVQGHTDDQPIIIKKPKPEPKPVAKKPEKPDPKKKPDVKPKDAKDTKDAKDAKDAKAPEPKPEPKEKDDKPDAVLAFMTNWELSAARALTVVHYLQDSAKLDPTRLAAVAFSQYRPVSKNRAKNRRIEIVLYPRARISPK